MIMTVAQFQKVNEILSTTPDTVEQLGWTICHVFNFTEDKVNRMGTLHFLHYVSRLERMMQAKPSRFRSLRLQTDASKITLGQFIECQHWLKTELIEVLDLVAASILIKRTDHARDAERIRAKSFNRVVPKVKLFIESLEKLVKSYAGLFDYKEAEEGEGTEQAEQEKQHPFVERYGWIFSAKELAAHQGISLDQAYDLPIIEAFNGLAYLKAKQSFDKMKTKQ